MTAYNPELESEFNNLSSFIREKYHVNIEEKEELKEYVIVSLHFLLSLKIWYKNLHEEFKKVNGINEYFEEMISNIIHSIILGTIDLKTTSLIMIRRTQELILSYFYYSEHPIEYIKKENDDNSRSLNGFKELKEYMKKYPYSSKYKLSDQVVQCLVSDIIDQWSMQYQELSNYVHGTNSKYFQKIVYVDEFSYDADNLKYLTIQMSKACSIINSLLIAFYFSHYIEFDEKKEKSLIRKSILNELGFKKRITDIFKEI